MARKLLVFTLVISISLPQVTPVFFDAIDEILRLGEGEERPLENDLESQILASRAYGQLGRLQISPRISLGGGVPVVQGPQIRPLRSIVPMGGIGSLGGIGQIGPLGVVGGQRYFYVSENALAEPVEAEDRGIFGGIRETIGNLIGFGRSEEEEEVALPEPPKMEQHIHTFDIIPQPLGIPLPLPPRPITFLPPPPPGIPIGPVPIHPPNPYLNPGGGVIPYGGIIQRGLPPPHEVFAYPGIPPRNFFKL